MSILIGPSKKDEVQACLSRKFTKGVSANPAAVTFLTSDHDQGVKIEHDDWVTYAVHNLQEKTIRDMIAEIVGTPSNCVKVVCKKDYPGFGDIISVSFI